MTARTAFVFKRCFTAECFTAAKKTSNLPNVLLALLGRWSARQHPGPSGPRLLWQRETGTRSAGFLSPKIGRDVVCGLCGAIWMDGVEPRDAGDAVIAVPRHPAVAGVNANGLTKATAMEKCRIDSSNIV